MTARYPRLSCHGRGQRHFRIALVTILLLSSTLYLSEGFTASPVKSRMLQLEETTRGNTNTHHSKVTESALYAATDGTDKTSNIAVPLSVWEEAAKSFVSPDFATNPSQLKQYVKFVTLLRVGVPAVAFGATAAFFYPAMSLYLAAVIDDYQAFGVIAQDSSQYIQNILTTCGLTFSILVGQTYYFMYQQQEEIYYALFEEVTVAKILLEQVALVCQGRKAMYQSILESIDNYVRNDLLNTGTDPAILLSKKPIDDPFERVMFLTSVGEPSIIYKTVRTLRQARARRLGALQKKLPSIHMILLYSLAGVVLCTFPVLGAGVQTLGGLAILKVQSWYLAFIVFGITMTLGIVNELRQPAGQGAYNVVSVLAVMVQGLEEELEGRMSGKYSARVSQELSPTIDPDPVINVDVSNEEEEMAVHKGEGTDIGAHVSAEEDEEDPPRGGWIGKRIARRFRNR